MTIPKQNTDDKQLFEKTIFITGGAGFIGSHIACELVKNERFQIIVYDKLDYCSSLHNLSSIKNKRNYVFIEGDICDEKYLRTIFNRYCITEVVHCAALTHVDRSFSDPESFWRTNVFGTRVLMKVASSKSRRVLLSRFLYIGTDEVYGCHGNEKVSQVDFNIELETRSIYKETSRTKPTNPYSKSKLAAERVLLSYQESHNFPVLFVRLNNVYGPYQYPEKVIPRFVSLLKQNRKCCIHGDGMTERNFLFVTDAVSAILLVLDKGEIGSIYNVGNDEHISVNCLAAILVLMVKGETECDKYIDYVADRIHNDRGYRLSSKRIQKLGWKAKVSRKEGLLETVKWYLENDENEIWMSLSDAYNAHY